jgi:fumarate reductase flavoprotein subunit
MMNPRVTQKIQNLKANIVIIGGGGGGLAAAVAAAEKQASVIVLEKRGAPGGNALRAGNVFAAESRLQKQLGIDTRRDEFFRKAMDHAHWKINPRLVRVLVDKSANTIQWLEEKGMEFVQVTPVSISQAAPAAHFGKGPGTTGAGVVRALVKSCEELGVRIICKARAKKLLTSEKGEVTGVLAEVKGEEVRITAKSVIIATGGFAGNNKLLRKYLPSYNEGEMYFNGLPHKGDGLLMATEIGAATDFPSGTAVLEMQAPVFPWSPSLWCIARRPNTIWVNKKGERFTDESIVFLFPESSNSIYRQPGKTSYTLFDEKIKQIIVEEGLYPWRDHIRGVDNKSWPTRVDKDLQLQADKGRVKISDSCDEIAKWIGAAPEVLKATIDEYNSFCDQGYDEIFTKDRRYLLPLYTPPYYAIQCCIEFIVTHGGIKINHHMEVLDKQENPIPGLFAAGVDAGGTDSDTYNVNLPGHSFGFTINSGRIAGENAVKFIKAK